MISPESYSKVKVGGLGRATDGLVKGLEENGVEVKLITPNENIYTSLFKKETEEKNRLLGKKASDFCIEKNWQPDWVWANDWGGVWSASEFKKFNKNPKVVWTVHSPISLNGYGSNYYGGAYGYSYSNDQETNVDWGDSFFDFSNLIKTGIGLADKTTTVSKGFAKVLKNSFLFENAKELEGINNGINLSEWNPKNDKLIFQKLKNENSWSNFKIANKRRVQQMFNLPIDENKPLFVFVSRLVEQKGLNLLLKVLPKLLAQNDFQFIFLGGGNRKFVEKINNLKNKFKEKLAAKTTPDFEMPHQLFAGVDFLVLPSISEPFGLVVAEAKRYGVLPIVYKIDGLKDQVQDGVNGFSFDNYCETGLEQKIIEACKSYGSNWQQNCLTGLSGQVTGWKETAREWLSLLYES